METEKYKIAVKNYKIYNSSLISRGEYMCIYFSCIFY